MNLNPGDFHFLRPLWFLALIPGLALFVALWRLQLRRSGWDRAINRVLLPHLLDSTPGAHRRWPFVLLLTAWFLGSVGLGGPVWERLPQPVRQKEDGLVIIQDLSLSFYAQDLSPNRLVRARHKLTDILKSRREGLTALIVYAGDAHVVTPLTSDTRTIEAMVGDLDPGIMPSYGSNLKSAVELALGLFKDSGLNRGRLLLLTDEVDPEQAAAVTGLLRGGKFTLSVLGVGTADGAPIPLGDGGFLKDDQGRIVVPRLDRAALNRLASDNGGRYRDIRIDDEDFLSLLAEPATMPQDDEYRESKRQFDQWQDQGYWLAVLLVPLGLLAFRRGWLLFALFLVLSFWPASNSYALDWQDLWLRRDQQAARALAANRPEEAAKLFQSQPWRGAARYRAGDYAQAVTAFNRSDNADDNYNRGNALARQGQLQQALEAYDRALQLKPGMTDARDNRELVAKLLEQQKQRQDRKEDQAGKQDQQDHKSQKDRQSQQNQEGQQEQQGQQKQAGRQNQEGQRKQAGQQDQEGQQDRQGQQNQPSPQDQQGKQNQQNQLGRQEQNNTEAEKAQSDRDDEPGKEGAERSMPEKNQADDRLDPEQQQALAQWLRQIPDDPGGLLRRKFQYQFQNNQASGADVNRKIW